VCAGQRRELSTWRNGRRHGHWEARGADGKLLDAGEMRDGTGEWRQWEKGELVERSSWLTGRLNGSYRRYEHGVVVDESNYVDGKRDGHSLSRRPDGTLSWDSDYAIGVQARARYYDDKGQLTSETQFAAGKPIVNRVYSHGKVVAEQRFVDGEPEDLQVK
jgi:antitoxin component YwqK of YwqJK toxin-antitoxin module